MPWTVVAESLALREAAAGLPPQLGLYSLRDSVRGDLLAHLQGSPMGRFKAGSAKLARVVAQSSQRTRSCLFQLDEPAGRVSLWDGSADRLGGGRAANDPRGLGRIANAAPALFDALSRGPERGGAHSGDETHTGSAA